MRSVLYVLAILLALPFAYAEQQDVYDFTPNSVTLSDEAPGFTLTEDLQYVQLQVTGEGLTPSGFEEASGKVTYMQIRDPEYVAENCDISYCTGYLYRQEGTLMARVPTKNDGFDDLKVGSIAADGTVSFEAMVKYSYVVQVASKVEERIGGQSGKWVAMELILNP